MDITKLSTEKRNRNTFDIDELSMLEVVRKINEEDRKVPEAIGKVLPDIAAVVERVIHAFKHGGRLIYIGAGTSGRLGVLDASECPPTYGIPPEMIIGILAGGNKAIQTAFEDVEDDLGLGRKDLEHIQLTNKDIVIAITASGRTPYAIGAIQYANAIGATTVALVCTSDSELERIAKYTIACLVGPEVITGSTRMKAGTAQKLVLNMISTASMIGMGKVYSNLMVDVIPSNEKLVERAVNIVMEATGATREEAKKALHEQQGHAKSAILQLLTDVSSEEAKRLLRAHDGRLKQAIDSIKNKK
ncbi:N-acetylmuramic acid 6-phosphate etherase [Fictibacillus sp. Mic-4]|uniref:N-acetylmuramic acid 6-phosphate etherase n=1 Tax=Fictibacillus TaxID=1329200 RepID=UPI000402C98D|nr:N-acetylmuramic acid 6-phosphate etherase [Fictibacillus gelatini]